MPATDMRDPADRLAARYGDAVDLCGRILVAIIFVPSGFAKLTALGAFAASLERNGVPFAQPLALIGAATEIIGPLAILVGLKLRYAALLMIAFVVIASLIAHRYWEFAAPDRRIQESAFYKNVGIIAGLLFLFVAGPGRFSIDHWLGRRTTAPTSG